MRKAEPVRLQLLWPRFLHFVFAAAALAAQAFARTRAAA